MTKTTQPHEVVKSKEYPTELTGWLASGTYLGAYALIILAYTITLILTLYTFMA
ncbi:hypothetical protein AMET1_1196 [Methanonatronarchaeum thermophilum]|uniref:Uncharacterized protein n=1 Tax=Methanonatronarchaeum thermophilum TaxID=1927129 RepID=A0A1Y3GFQ5_9EURY|nr:hypothetical protein [Methanonatronarchaeum thermophilum]OUJ18285.1 hypothetical protein AMET1_1196 [Methanonatronarchaeum thermophilum]